MGRVNAVSRRTAAVVASSHQRSPDGTAQVHCEGGSPDLLSVRRSDTCVAGVGMREIVMTGQVVHFEIPADDLSRASEFYRAAFGWDVSSVAGMDYAMLGTTTSDASGMPKDPGAINGGMLLRDEARTGPIITVDVDDIDAALQRIEDLGGAIVLPKQEVMGMGYTAYFVDSEGNVMGLWQNAGTA